MTIRLEVGLVNKPNKNIELLKEILNHQGIIFQEIHAAQTKTSKFPCVLLIEDNKDDYTIARELCITEENILVVEKIIPLDIIFSSLSGTYDKLYLEDKLISPQTTDLELGFINEIRSCYYRLGLPFARKWYWPNFAKACCLITHDIDELEYLPSKKRVFESLKYYRTKLLLKKPYGNNIEELLKIEKEKRIKATFYFFPDYGKHQKEFIDCIGLLDNNHEVGLHAPFPTHDNPKILKKHKKMLSQLSDRKIKGVRQHGLYFSELHTWKYQDIAGFDYDITFFYNDKFGFRAGLCHPYHPFNILTKEKYNIIEIPTSYMDWTGIYKELNYDQMLSALKKLGKNVEKYHGCLVFLFHNLLINKKVYPDISKLFNTTLDYVKNKGYWVTTAGDCAKWWRTRENAKITIKFEEGMISGTTTTSLPICIEQDSKKKIFNNIDNIFQIQLKK